MEAARVLKIIIEIDGNIVYEGKSFLEGLVRTLPDTIAKTEVTSELNQQNVKKQTLMLNEVCEDVFNKSISKDKLYAMVRQNKIPHFKIGSKILFKRETLEAWIKESEDRRT
jgi:excisionase family DNA binding protein